MLILYCLGPVGKISAKSLFLWGAAITVAIAIAGCGGGSDSSSGSTAAGGETTSAANEISGKSAQGKGESSSGKAVPAGDLSKSAFVKQANAICEEGKKQSLEKMGAYVKEHKGSSETANLKLIGEAIRTVFIPQIQDQIDAIRVLGAPAGDEAQVEGILTALEENAEAALDSSGTSAALGQSFKSSAELAHEYGLDGCAYG